MDAGGRRLSRSSGSLQANGRTQHPFQRRREQAVSRRPDALSLAPRHTLVRFAEVGSLRRLSTNCFPSSLQRRCPPSYLLQLLCRTSRSCLVRSTARSTRERTTQTPASTVSFPNFGCFGGRPPPFRSTLRCPTHRRLRRLSSPGTGGGRGVA
jgi:hypothetical protein